MCHACGPSSDCGSSLFFVTGISLLWTFFFGWVCWQLCWRVSLTASLILFWPSAVEDWAFLAASWQYWGIPVACWWWRTSAHCNIVWPWQLRAAPWQIFIWEFNQDIGTWKVMMVNGGRGNNSILAGYCGPSIPVEAFFLLFSQSQKGRWCGDWWPLWHGFHLSAKLTMIVDLGFPLKTVSHLWMTAKGENW